MILEEFQRLEVVDIDLVLELVLDNRIIAERKVQSVNASGVLFETMLKNAVFGFLVVQRPLEWDAVHLSDLNYDQVSVGTVWWCSSEHPFEGFLCTSCLPCVLTISLARVLGCYFRE